MDSQGDAFFVAFTAAPEAVAAAAEATRALAAYPWPEGATLRVRMGLHTGGSWRALPERFGPWQTVAGCYHRWHQAGVWEQIRQVLLAPDVPYSSSA